MDSSTVICWMSPFAILWVSCLSCRFYSILFLMKNPVSKQCTYIHYVVSDLDLHCLSMAFNGFPIKNGLQRMERKKNTDAEKAFWVFQCFRYCILSELQISWGQF